MYKELLLDAGLSENEAIIYEYLLKTGKATAGEMIKATPLNRGVTYNTLASLVAKNLVSESKIKARGARGKNIIAEFAPNHPENLRIYMEDEKKELEKAEKNLEANLASLVSDFSLVSGRPGVRYFEGEAGVRKVLADTLTSKTEILTIADVESIRRYAQKINEQYVQERNRAGVGKRLLALDSEYAREHFRNKNELTDVKLVKLDIVPFDTSIHIYDGRIAYITTNERYFISTIINDPAVYSMQKAIFNFIWSAS